MTKGSAVFVALLGACAASGGGPPAPVERPAADRWALPAYADEIEHSCTSGGRRCPKGLDVPECASAPAASELSPIDGGLLAKIGRRVTVVSKPSPFGVTCTPEGCDCCNRCSGALGLCGNDAHCAFAIAVGDCDGDQNLTFELERPEYCYLAE